MSWGHAVSDSSGEKMVPEGAFPLRGLCWTNLWNYPGEKHKQGELPWSWVFPILFTGNAGWGSAQPGRVEPCLGSPLRAGPVVLGRQNSPERC